MSTYYYTKIFTKKRVEEGKENPFNWEEVDSGCVNIYKNLLSGWDSPLESIYPGKDLEEKANTYYTYEYIGLYKQEDINRESFTSLGVLDPNNHYHNKDDIPSVVILDSDKNPLICTNSKEAAEKVPGKIELYSKDELERYKEHNIPYNSNYILFEDYQALSANDKQTKYINVFYKRQNNYNGKFYTKDEFEKHRAFLQSKYDDAIKQLNLWENTKKSLEYLKLSSEEQENVSTNFEYLPEIIDEYKYQLDTCMYFITLAMWFDSDKDYPKVDDNDWRGRDVLFYIYSM